MSTFELRWLHNTQYQHIILFAINDLEDSFLTRTAPSLKLTGKKRSKSTMACSNLLLQNHTESWDYLKCSQ